MQTYELMLQYALSKKLPPEEDSITPELGKSLSLLHSCLIEANLKTEAENDKPRVTESPSKFSLSHLSRFVTAFLPFNSVSTQSEANEILFDVLSFVKWLEKRDIEHGWSNIDFQTVVKDLTQAQSRCLELSQQLDEETGRTLEDLPQILETLNGVFTVIKIEGLFLSLSSPIKNETLRLQLPAQVIPLVRINDHLDLVLGDTSEKWVILEAGQVFPKYDKTPS